MAVAAALRVHTDGNAGGRFLSGAAGVWNGGNAGVGTLAVGFVPVADVNNLEQVSRQT